MIHYNVNHRVDIVIQYIIDSVRGFDPNLLYFAPGVRDPRLLQGVRDRRLLPGVRDPSLLDDVSQELSAG